MESVIFLRPVYLFFESEQYSTVATIQLNFAFDIY